jgi:hypothetical protein
MAYIHGYFVPSSFEGVFASLTVAFLKSFKGGYCDVSVDFTTFLDIGRPDQFAQRMPRRADKNRHWLPPFVIIASDWALSDSRKLGNN